MRPGFDARLWDSYAPFFDAEEGTVFPVDEAELLFYGRMRRRLRGRALEIGAGCGRLARSLFLSPEHLTVALEPSRGMLSRWGSEDASMASRIRALGQEMPFPCNSFMLAAFPYNGMHCILDPAGRSALLREAARVLEPEGRVLLETCPLFAARPEDTDSVRYDFFDGRLRLRLEETVRKDLRRGSITFFMKYTIGSAGVSELALELALIPPGLLLAEIEEAGLSVEEIWGDYDFSPFDAEASPRMLTLASRKDAG